MHDIIEKLIKKYFEHLTKKLWLKDICSTKNINIQKILSNINDELDHLIYDVLLFIENQIELTKNIISDDIENIIWKESTEENEIKTEEDKSVWEINNE